VGTTKLESVDGFTYVDVVGAPRMIGPIRCAKKVLPRTTIDLSRHVTYALAVHGLDGAGAAAALNHDRSDEPDPIPAFIEEVTSWTASNNFGAHTGLGLSDDEIAGLLARPVGETLDGLIAATAVASAGDLTNATVVIASSRDEGEVIGQLASVDVTIIEDLATALATPSDVLFVRSGTGALHHEIVADTAAKKIVGIQALTITARGLAVASRAGAVVVPDFMSAAGPYLAAFGIDDPATATSETMRTLDDGSPDLFVNACVHAEAHLRTWADALPFGRPLAP
jgi:hypothetical protein